MVIQLGMLEMRGFFVLFLGLSVSSNFRKQLAIFCWTLLDFLLFGDALWYSLFGSARRRFFPPRGPQITPIVFQPQSQFLTGLIELLISRQYFFLAHVQIYLRPPKLRKLALE